MKPLIVSLAILATLGATMQPASAKQRACTYRVTPTQDSTFRTHRVQALIRCVFSKVGIPSQIPMALYVADRESSFYPWAWNRSSDCRGLFQHMGRYWAARTMMLPPAQFPKRVGISAFNARANAWVTAVMVRSGGWGPWAL